MSFLGNIIRDSRPRLQRDPAASSTGGVESSVSESLAEDSPAVAPADLGGRSHALTDEVSDASAGMPLAADAGQERSATIESPAVTAETSLSAGPTAPAEALPGDRGEEWKPAHSPPTTSARENLAPDAVDDGSATAASAKFHEEAPAPVEQAPPGAHLQAKPAEQELQRDPMAGSEPAATSIPGELSSQPTTEVALAPEAAVAREHAPSTVRSGVDRPPQPGPTHLQTAEPPEAVPTPAAEVMSTRAVPVQTTDEAPGDAVPVTPQVTVPIPPAAQSRDRLPVATNRPRAATEDRPRVQIGRVDIVIQAPPTSSKQTAAQGSAADVSSRLYLRRA